MRWEFFSAWPHFGSRNCLRVEALAIAAVLSVGGLTAIAFLESAPYERQSKLHQPSPTP
jgi:hypothetical protein